jgi:hypothetical protein
MVKIRIRDAKNSDPGRNTAELLLLTTFAALQMRYVYSIDVCTATARKIVSGRTFFPLVGTSIEGYYIRPPRLSSLLNAHRQAQDSIPGLQ